jgi:hypothetical protein
MSLLTIYTKALQEISRFDVSPFILRQHESYRHPYVASANAECAALEVENRWRELITEYTFTTASRTECDSR